MDYEGRFIMQKTVDWSLLNDEMTISVSVCSLFYPTTSTTSQSRKTMILRILLSSVRARALLACYHRDARTSTGLSTRTIRGPIARTKRSTAEGKVKFQFEFENGEVLRLKLYEHLKV